MNTSSSVGEVAFGIVRNVKSAGFPEENSNIEWDRLVSKYAAHRAFSLLKLKSKFHNSNLASGENEQDELILNL